MMDRQTQPHTEKKDYTEKVILISKQLTIVKSLKRLTNQNILEIIGDDKHIKQIESSTLFDVNKNMKFKSYQYEVSLT